MALAKLESEYISKWRYLRLVQSRRCDENDRQVDPGRLGSNHLIHVLSSWLPLDEPVVKHLRSFPNIHVGYLAGFTVEWWLTFPLNVPSGRFVLRKGRGTEWDLGSRTKRIFCGRRSNYATTFHGKDYWNKWSQADCSLCIPRDSISKAPH